MGCASSTIIAPSAPSPSVSRVGTHPHQPPQVHRPPTSPVMRLVAALSVALHPHHPPQVHRPPTSSMTRVVAPLSVAAPRYEHHLGPHHAAMPHRAPPLRRPVGQFRMMKTKKYGEEGVHRKHHQRLVRVIKKFASWRRLYPCNYQTSNGLKSAHGWKTTPLQRVAGIRQPSRSMMMSLLSDVSCPASHLLCNAYMLCVSVCHRPFNNAASLPAFMSHADYSEVAWRQSVARAREYLNHVVQEIRWADGLNPFNHCPHFPFFMTHFTDPMPINSIGGI